jgi:hypothetical protein
MTNSLIPEKLRETKVSLPWMLLIMLGFTGGGAGGYSAIDDFFSMKKDVKDHKEIIKSHTEQIAELRTSINQMTQNQIHMIESVQKVHERLDKQAP